MSKAIGSLNIPDRADALEFAARVLELEAALVPAGHEDRTRGSSTFNWMMHIVFRLRAIAEKEGR